MDNPLFEGASPSAGAVAEPRKRGRPKGSTNKRSADLVSYIEAQYAGLTPGQVSAAIGLVTPRELRAAKGKVIDALVTKAKQLGRDLGIGAAEAWELMRRERSELMPYVHQRRPQAVDIKGGAILPMVVIGGAEPAGQLLEGDFREVEPEQALNQMQPLPVSSAGSHGEG